MRQNRTMARDGTPREMTANMDQGCCRMTRMLLLARNEKKMSEAAAYLHGTRSPAPATLGFLVFGLLLFAGEEARAQSAIRKVPPEQQKTSSPDDAVDPLKQFNASSQALVARISPAVVEIRVTGFGPSRGI